MPAARLNLVAPLAADPASLPNGDSPNLELVLANAEEQEHCTLLNCESWAGPLDTSAYLRREKHIAATYLAKDGGLSCWILVDKNDKTSPRTILAACESLRKRALVAELATQLVKDIWAFTIGNVYCRGEYRGKGYAVRMMAELRKKLEHWQQESGSKTAFTALYSDIGKKFYAKNGWTPYASSHASLTARRSQYVTSEVQLLRARDLSELCRRDERNLRRRLEDFSTQTHDFRVAFIPDYATMAWHHAREEFTASELFDREADIKGAMISSNSDRTAWCIWTRRFAKDQKNNVLYVLRVVTEEQNLSDEDIDRDSVQQVAACLATAQKQAVEWGLGAVVVWNPSATVLAACRELEPDLELVHRHEESVACLNWYGEHPGIDKVEWLANEKFGWC